MYNIEHVEINAEYLAQMYFRINGFFILSDFIVHTDINDRQGPRTDIDICAIRYPHTRLFVDDDIADDDLFKNEKTPLCIIGEVKLNDKCQINPTLTSNDTLERVFKVIGIYENEINLVIAQELRETGKFETEGFKFKFVGIGNRESNGFNNRYKDGIQITWDRLLKFIYHRFREVRIQKRNNAQWETIGRDVFSLANRFEEFEEFKDHISIDNKIEKKEKYKIILNKMLDWPFDFQHALYKISNINNRPNTIISLKKYLLNTHFNGRVSQLDKFIELLEKEKFIKEKYGAIEYMIDKIT